MTYKTKRAVYDLRTIAEVEGAGVKGGKHAEWREQIIVPPLPQSGLAGCSLIEIDYFIQVSQGPLHPTLSRLFTQRTVFSRSGARVSVGSNSSCTELILRGKLLYELSN